MPLEELLKEWESCEMGYRGEPSQSSCYLPVVKGYAAVELAECPDEHSESSDKLLVTYRKYKLHWSGLDGVYGFLFFFFSGQWIY